MAALKAAHISTIELGIDGQFLLREATLDAMFPEIPSNKSPTIHRGRQNISLFIKPRSIVDDIFPALSLSGLGGVLPSCQR
jgi:hypothetical protein